jgi:uracil-DNA glycosylase family 4
MSQIGSKYVPHDGPQGAKILIVGEAPGAEEEFQGLPFVGKSGQLLQEVLLRYGLTRNDVRLANLCNYRPSSNKFENLIGSRELSEGLDELRDYIREYPPNIILGLGAKPLNYLCNAKGIDAWRGSFIPTTLSGCPSVKYIGTYHPAFVLRDRTKYPIFDFDIAKAVKDGEHTRYDYPTYNIKVVSNQMEAYEAAEFLCKQPKLANDIESVKGTTQIICIGFAYSPTDAIVFPWEPNYLEYIYKVLQSQAAKTYHFGTYDETVIQENGYSTRAWNWDTLVAQHILNPELPRSLAFLASIYTRQPYYKSDGRSTIPSDSKAWSRKHDKLGLYQYNGTDCCVTYTIREAQEPELEKRGLLDLFRQEFSEIEAAIAIGRAGMPVDAKRRLEIQHIILVRWARKQSALDRLVGEHVNVRSPKLKTILYDKLKLPVRKKRDGTITTDEDAIVSLIAFCKQRVMDLKRADSKIEWQVKMGVCSGILEIRGLRQMLSNYILAKTSDDLRIRSIYKVAGPETGRWAGEHFVDKTGLNPQTFPRGHVEATDEDQAMINEALALKLLTELDENDRMAQDQDTTGVEAEYAD